MAEPFCDLVDAPPTPRRERIEAQTQALIREYELLKALRQDRRVTQKQLAALMGIRQASVSKIENQDDMRLSTLRKYVEALGGELELRVRFADRDVRLEPLDLDLGTALDEEGDRGRAQEDGAGEGVRVPREAGQGEVGTVGVPEQGHRAGIEAVDVGGVAHEPGDRVGFRSHLLLIDTVRVAPEEARGALLEGASAHGDQVRGWRRVAGSSWLMVRITTRRPSRPA